jgi:uncharacterized membrane protein
MRHNTPGGLVASMRSRQSLLSSKSIDDHSIISRVYSVCSAAAATTVAMTTKQQQRQQRQRRQRQRQQHNENHATTHERQENRHMCADGTLWRDCKHPASHCGRARATAVQVRTKLEHELVELLLQGLVCVVDAQLLEAVELEVLLVVKRHPTVWAEKIARS